MLPVCALPFAIIKPVSCDHAIFLVSSRMVAFLYAPPSLNNKSSQPVPLNPSDLSSHQICANRLAEAPVNRNFTVIGVASATLVLNCKTMELDSESSISSASCGGVALSVTGCG